MMKSLLLTLVISAMAVFSTATAQEYHDSLLIINYLSSGEIGVSMPAFHSEPNVKGKIYGEKDLLKQQYLIIDKPGADEEYSYGEFHDKWTAVKTGRDGYILPSKSREGSEFNIHYLLAYIEAGSFMKISLHIESRAMLEVILDGKVMKSKVITQNDEEDPGKTTLDITLRQGKHQLIIKSLYTADNKENKKTRASITFEKEGGSGNLNVGISPIANVTIKNILCGKRVRSIKPSFDGAYYFLSTSETNTDDGKTVRHYEIRSSQGNTSVAEFFHSKASSYKWSPVSNDMAYTTNKGDKTILWIFSPEVQSSKKAGEIDNFNSYEWSPDGSYFIVTVSEKADKRKDVDRLEGMNDRQPWWRTRKLLYQLFPESGTMRRLSWGHLSTSLADISPDSKNILFTITQPDYSSRPYRITTVCLLNLETMMVDTIWRKKYSGKLAFSPDGRKLLCTGGAGHVWRYRRQCPGNQDPQ